MRSLGADTLRLAVKWSEVAPHRASTRALLRRHRPEAVPRVRALRRCGPARHRQGHAPDPRPGPRCAAVGDRRRCPLGTATGNREPDPREFARFAAAVGTRYSGDFEGLPKVEWFSLWNEPNHHFFLKPNEDAPRSTGGWSPPRCRPCAMRRAPTRRCWWGKPHPSGARAACSGRATSCAGGCASTSASSPRRTSPGCGGFRGFDVDGYAHHPYGPTSRDPGACGHRQHAGDQAARALPRSGRGGRAPAARACRSTTPSSASSRTLPIRRRGSTSREQAALLNEKEEQSYRYPRVRSYAQYLMYDDPPREGATPQEIWSGFQTGLRFPTARRSPPTMPTACRSWCSVRAAAACASGAGSGPGTVCGGRSAMRAGAWGDAWRPNDAGYFEVTLPDPELLQFRRRRRGRQAGWTSRNARPVAATPSSD